MVDVIFNVSEHGWILEDSRPRYLPEVVPVIIAAVKLTGSSVTSWGQWKP